MAGRPPAPGLGSRTVLPSDPQGPFAPASIRIYPLTHVGEDQHGRHALILHLELRDRWNDAVKGIGHARVVLSQPGTTADPTQWDVDLSDLVRNASLYDPATRTYRLPLIGLPAAFTSESRGEVRVIFDVPDGRGGTETVRDRFDLGRFDVGESQQP